MSVPVLRKDTKETRRRSVRISIVYDKMLVVSNVMSEGSFWFRVCRYSVSWQDIVIAEDREG